MKRGFIVILALFSFPLYAQKTLGDGIKDLATQITASAAKQEKRRVAVLPFRELDGQPTVLGTYLAEELVTNLFQMGNFKIVERQMLDKVLGELKIEQSGAIDPKTAKEIGRIAAVDAIVTGSITDLESFVAINCRLIDTTTGEVFGAAQTKITKNDDVNKVMSAAVLGAATGTTASAAGTDASYQSAKAIATKDIGSLRVVLKSVLPMKVRDRNGNLANGIRCSFDFASREAQRTLAVAMNATPGNSDSPYAGVRNNSMGDVLRASLVDDRGGAWSLWATNVIGISIVSAGKRNFQSAFEATDIASLLQRKDAAGTNMMKAESDNPWIQPYAFVFGSTTQIAPGQSASVVMTFAQDGGDVFSGTQSTFFQLSGEIVVGVLASSSKTSYALHNLTFDRITMPKF